MKARLELLRGGAGATATGQANQEKRKVTRRGALSRDRIIDAALAILAEGGNSALSISAVCARAEVSPASLYHHFGDKAGLMKAMIEDSLYSAARRFSEAVLGFDHPVDQLRAYVDVMKVLGRDYRNNTIGVLASLAQGCSESPDISDAIENVRTRAWRYVTAEMNDIFGLEDGMMLTHLQFAFATYIIHVAQSSKGRDDVRALYNSYWRILVITMASLKPEYLKDPRFAATLAEACRDPPV
ncbi:MAG: TetR/AcrR family transcriptional regulator [Alphaproteobacteria bacterium]|nr:TetR/AcrR family transcriptional regulator [Alphaproteobacteria bacterium]